MTRKPGADRLTRRACCVLLILAVLAGWAGCDSASEPKPDWTGLLTDEELWTAEDPNAPEENPEWAAWVGENNIPVRSLEADNFTDLLSLRPFLQGRRIVQLGENGHGVAEFNKVKVRLVKVLHEVMGFNVIAFESSIYECFYANASLSSASPDDVMAGSIVDVWHSNEVLPLFEYLRQRHSADHPLTLAGFDVRISSPRSVASRPEFFRQVLAQADQEFADFAFELDSELIVRRQETDYFINYGDSLIGEYDNIVDFISRHEEDLGAAFPQRPELVLVSKQVARSISKYIDQARLLMTGQEDSAYEVRDEGMAENLEFLLNELYPNDKVIVWAHNAHVSHDYESIPERERKNMGGRIRESHRPELYTVGLYMYRGSAATNQRVTLQVPPSQSGSIESVLYRTRRRHCFIDLLGQVPGKGTSWMFETVQANEWSHGSLSLVPRDQYDGLLFIDTVSPPDYAGDQDDP